MWSKFANVTPALGNLRGGKFGQFGGPFIKEESFTFHHIRSFNACKKTLKIMINNTFGWLILGYTDFNLK